MNCVRSLNRSSLSINDKRKISKVRECMIGARILSKIQTRYLLTIRQDIPVVYEIYMFQKRMQHHSLNTASSYM